VLIGCGAFDRATRERTQVTCAERMDAQLRQRLGHLKEEFPDPDARQSIPIRGKWSARAWHITCPNGVPKVRPVRPLPVAGKERSRRFFPRPPWVARPSVSGRLRFSQETTTLNPRHRFAWPGISLVADHKIPSRAPLLQA
jgi:hypothetical protein